MGASDAPNDALHVHAVVANTVRVIESIEAREALLPTSVGDKWGKRWSMVSLPVHHGRCDLELIHSTIAANPMPIVATHDP